MPLKSEIPPAALQASIFFIAKTHEEISIVVPENISLPSDECDTGWRALEVVGPLGFTLTGILANLATVLANNKISIFALSTFDTDYILIKKDTVNSAIKALKKNDYAVVGY
jgi:hypothetical protein